MAQEEANSFSPDNLGAGPLSYDEIEHGLLLGNLTAATDINWLKEAKVSHILTIDSCPLPRKIQALLPNLITKYIQITDMPREDLLSHFEGSYQFISDALESNGKVLVHCYFGVSRSATIVIAYIMKKHQMTYSQAFEIVKEKRRFVGPNPGFVAQLKLFETMDCVVDPNNNQFKMYRLQIAADKVRKAKILPQSFIDLIKPDPALPSARPEPTVYRCKKCRRIVASASNILPHTQRERQIWRHISTKRTSKQIKSDHAQVEPVKKEDQSPAELCSKTYFIEPLAWMPDITHNVEGKLKCPKCSTKLGSFSWVTGIQCPCGSKIAPAFYLVPSKVDWSNAVQNVQVTV